MLCAKFGASLVQVGEITWEEFENVGLRHFVNLREKTVGVKWA